MTDVFTRAGKSAPLSYAEMDANITRLNQEKYGQGSSPSVVNITFSGLLAATAPGADAITATLTNGVTDPAFKLIARNGKPGTAGSLQAEFGLSYSGAPITAGVRLYRGNNALDSAIALVAGNANAVTLDSNGNIGQGLAPFAWRGSEKAIDIGATASFAYYSGLLLANNAYIGAGGWLAKTTGVAQNVQINASGLQFNQAASVAAGAAPAWVTSFAIDAKGNGGLGITPNTAWGTTFKAFDLPYGCVLDNGVGQFGLAVNAYSDGTNWRLRANGAAAMYQQDFATGNHDFFSSVAGVGGGTASFINSLRLDAGSNMILQGASGAATHNIRLVSANTAAQMRVVWNNAGAFAGIGSDASGNTILGRCASLTGTGVTVHAILDTAGNLLLTGGTGGLGYGPGSGSAVTQGAGSGKATAVTLNKPSGQITMNAAALAAGATVYFTLQSSVIGTSDTITVNPVGFGSYDVKCNQILSAGNAQIEVKNKSAGSLSEAIVLNFNVHKGSST